MGKLRSYVRQHHLGLVAIFIALSGTAYAATELEKNEVKSKHIGKGQVKNADLGNNAVTSPKVANGSLLGEDFAPGQLSQGPQGPQGLQGERGPSGATNVTRRVSARFTVQADATQDKVMPCNADERATGGGYVFTGFEDSPKDFDVDADYPEVSGALSSAQGGTPTGWHVQVQNLDVNNGNTGTVDFNVYAVCASP